MNYGCVRIWTVGEIARDWKAGKVPARVVSRMAYGLDFKLAGRSPEPGNYLPFAGGLLIASSRLLF